MLGHILPVIRRCLSVVNDSKVFQTLFRYFLRVVLFPGLLSLVLLSILYSIAERTFANWYFATDYVWQPAYPSSWRILFLSLFVVPTLAFLHLLWFFLQHLVPSRLPWRDRCDSDSRPSQGYRMLQRSSSNLPEERGLTSAVDDEDDELHDLEEQAGSSTPHTPPFQHPAPRRPLAFVRSWRFVFWFVILCTSLWFGLRRQYPGDLRYLPQIEKANTYPKRAGYGNQEKIFIAAMFYNNEKVLPYWSDSLVKVINYLGADNVFVSILESNSDDQSPVMLQQLDDRLGAMDVKRRILTNDEAVKKPGDLLGNHRTIFLSALRNHVLEPLVESGGYDKVLFSNDIFVEPESILELLYTAEGAYDMACAMDFGRSGFYDTWVVRDKGGRLASSLWPYFFEAEGYEAMEAESPVPVFTCWNGIVAVKADPLLPIHLRSNSTLSNEPLPFSLPASHPAAADSSLRGPSPALTPPVRFRASAPEECYSSECFLFPYDLRRLFDMRRIFVNPRVIVGYEWPIYAYYKWFMRHPVLKWWVEKVYAGAWMYKVVVVAGDPRQVFQWDGGDCWPWHY